MQPTENNHSQNLVSNATIEKIRKELIEPTYYNDVRVNIHSKSRWKSIGDMSETLAHVLIGCGAMFAFASVGFGYEWLSFLSGCLSTASLVFLKFSMFAAKESEQRTIQVNKLLNNINISSMPDIVIDPVNDLNS